jgi:hypothetical protein
MAPVARKASISSRRSLGRMFIGWTIVGYILCFKRKMHQEIRTAPK